jgi:hypothetical protein
MREDGVSAMPLHDWSRVDVGIFHDFHIGWTAELVRAFNHGAAFWYARTAVQGEDGHPFAAEGRGENDQYAQRRRSISIYREDDGQVVARIEMVSPAEKADKCALDCFVSRAATMIQQGVHLLLLDIHPPMRFDLAGVHFALWKVLGFKAPSDLIRPPMTASYRADGLPKTVVVRPLVIGQPLIDMPLMVEPGAVLNVPLEETYMAAYAGTARFYRDILEA